MFECVKIHDDDWAALKRAKSLRDNRKTRAQGFLAPKWKCNYMRFELRKRMSSNKTKMVFSYYL